MLSFLSHVIEYISPLFKKEYFHNPLYSYLLSILIFIILIIITIIFKVLIVKRIKKLVNTSDNKIDDFIFHTLEQKIYFPLFYGAFFLSVRNLKLAEKFSHAVNIIGIIVFSIFIFGFISRCLRYWLINYVLIKETDNTKRAIIKGVFPALNVILWTIGLIFLLDNLGFDVSSIIAGLGIGGVAIALASQVILGDMFSYFCILLDQPFMIGDFIIIQNYMGTVEKIGIKTTKIRSLEGEQIIIPNSILTEKEVKNYKRMKKRRVVFHLGIAYDTSSELLEKIPVIIKTILENFSEIEFNYACFASYKELCLNYEIVYYINSSDYNLYMSIQEKININLKKEFKKEGIKFAYPVQMVYIRK